MGPMGSPWVGLSRPYTYLKTRQRRTTLERLAQAASATKGKSTRWRPVAQQESTAQKYGKRRDMEAKASKHARGPKGG